MQKLTSEDNDRIENEVRCESRLEMEKAGWSFAKIARELKTVAFSDIKDHVTIDEGGAMQAKPLTEMKTKSRAVKKVKEKTIITESKDGETLYKTSTITYELYDKLEALKLGASIMGMSVPKQINMKHSGYLVGVPYSSLSDEKKRELDKILEALYGASA